MDSEMHPFALGWAVGLFSFPYQNSNKEKKCMPWHLYAFARKTCFRAS